MITMKIFSYPIELKSFSIRINATFVFLFSCSVLGIYFFNKEISLLLVFFLFYEFLMTFLGFFSLSILKKISDWIYSKFFYHRQEVVYYRPKRFAKFCGLTLIMVSFVFYFFKSEVFLILIGTLSLFSFLEAFFDFCIACKIYYLAQKFKLIPEDSCRDCR